MILNLKKVREQKRMSQGKLSKITGFSQGYISQLENNSKTPTLKTIEVIANALEVCPLALISCTCSPNCTNK